MSIINNKEIIVVIEESLKLFPVLLVKRKYIFISRYLLGQDNPEIKAHHESKYQSGQHSLQYISRGYLLT